MLLWWDLRGRARKEVLSLRDEDEEEALLVKIGCRIEVEAEENGMADISSSLVSEIHVVMKKKKKHEERTGDSEDCPFSYPFISLIFPPLLNK